MSEPTRATDRRDLLRESLQAIERLQSRLDASERARREPIAIVGLGCRYPGAPNPDAFWELLRNGRDAVRDVPADRWDADAYYDSDPAAPGKSTTRRGGFLDRVDLFDARFFGISPREAATLDPQQRLLLELAWETLEDAGIPPDRLSGSATGVFVGITTTDYARHLQIGSASGSDVYAATGNALNAAAGRISFVLGLQGPCLAIDTACSSSLVAVHEACQALRAGECDLALAGGINIMLSPIPSILFSKWGMLAIDGRCKAFDVDADGFVRGEGCGMVALRRLSDAEADGDTILAVIRGSAVNSDGRSSGLTVPNGPAQQKVIRRALEMARIAPSSVDYVEAHGTGTPLGDPIEVEALAATLCADRPADRPLLLGAVKTNIGHTESASGVAGLIKVVLSLRAGLLPKQLHFTAPNPRIDWGDGKLKVVAEPTPWTRGERPRIAGVSSFGFSGTNAHVVVSEAPLRAPAPAVVERPMHLLLVSARTPTALRTLVTNVRDRLLAGEENFADVCYSLAAGRARLTDRLAVVAANGADAAAELTRFLDGDTTTARVGHVDAGRHPRLAWLFTGQGAQWVGMGRDLYDTLPVFRAAMDRCAAVIDPLRDRKLLDVMFGRDGVPETLLDETRWTQPALFALEYALASTLRDWGIQPTALAGHSLGEYVAACVAGVLPLESVMQLVATRADLMQALPPGGAMVALAIAETDAAVIAEVRDGSLSIAASNGPESVVLSGPASAINAVAERSEAAGIRVNRLVVSHAFHSALIEPALAPFERALSGLPFADPTVPLMTNLTGQQARAGELSSPAYWTQQLRGTVRFADALRSLAAAGCDTFVEIGPHPVLLAMARDTVGGDHRAWLPLLRRRKDAWPQLLDTLGEFFVRGGDFDARAFDAPYGRRRVPVAMSPFERERHWIDPVDDERASPRAHLRKGSAQLLGGRVVSPMPGAQFANELSATSPAFVADHVIFGTTLLPGTAFVEIGLAAAKAVGIAMPIALDGLELGVPLALTSPTQLHVLVEAEQRGVRSIRVSSAMADGGDEPAWREHATMRASSRSGDVARGGATFAETRALCTEAIDTHEFYERLSRAGLGFGPIFRGMRELRVGPSQAVGRIALPDGALEGAQQWLLHPAQLDACFHVIGARLAAERSAADPDVVYLPIAIDALTLLRAATPELMCVATLRAERKGQELLRVADLRLETPDGELVATINGLTLRRVTPDVLQRAIAGNDLRQTVSRVVWVPRVPSSSASRPSGRVLVVPDASGIGAALTITLLSQGVDCALLPDAASLRDDIRPLTNALRGADGAATVSWVIDCNGIDAGSDAVSDGIRARYLHLLQVGQALLDFPATGLAVITSGAVTTRPSEPPDLTIAPLSGLARTIAAERGFAPALRLDIERGTARAADAISAALTMAVETPEMAWRGAEFLVPRLELLPDVSPASPERRALVIRERGVLENLAVLAQDRRAPGTGEVEIAVRAAGLNFRDVLNALGMYPGDPGPLGSECSGVVTAVGAGVADIAVGDEVVAFAGDSFATHAIARAALTVPKPAALDFDAAVSLPNAYVTAAFALRNVAQIRPGQRVLVHAAMGGVGLAAMRLARAAGAEVIATAGSPEKRARALQEGAAHAFDSRSVGFADDVLRVTAGRGVDIVVNSLAGEFIAAGMRVLADGGCFVELGKNGIWTEAQAASRFPHVRYVVVDIGVEIQRDVHVIGRLFSGLVDEVAAGALSPLPVERFALDDAVTAFRHMAMARHMGKVVLVPSASTAAPIVVRADGTYVVTGGLGGLGLAVAAWLTKQGARSLVLLGRRAPDAATDAVLAGFRASGASVLTPMLDVADASAVRALWQGAIAALPPVRGIVHAAGVNADAALHAQDAMRFDTVAAAKISGTLNLHDVSRADPLDFFVLFSSSSALFGSAGQAPYAAANAFLDAFAARRRSDGQVATSFGWGAWGGVGMASAVPEATRRRWAEGGIGLLEPGEALDAMSRTALGGDALLEIFAFDRARLLHRADAGVRSLFGAAAKDDARPQQTASATPAHSVFDALRSAPAADRFSRLRAHIRSQVCSVLGLGAAAAPDDGQGLSELGMDSLMATELRTRLQQSLGAPLPSTLAFEYPTIGAMTTYLMAKLGFVAEPVAVAVGVDELDSVSDDDIARLLDDELNQAGF